MGGGGGEDDCCRNSYNYDSALFQCKNWYMYIGIKMCLFLFSFLFFLLFSALFFGMPKGDSVPPTPGSTPGLYRETYEDADSI